ncbi:MAG: hypothetical protein ACREMP_04875 [Candidatus Tyrphobacter sp.]
MRKIFAEHDVRCPFSAAIEMVARLHDSGMEHVVGPFSALRAPVVCHFSQVRDYTDDARIHEALVLSWEARARIPVPRMKGLITVRPNGATTTLRMDGEYEPPLGFPGRIFDEMAGRHIALRTIRRFLRELGEHVEAEWRAEQRSYAAAPTRRT